MRLTILYRGPLASCNYACAYCPFAKQTFTSRQLEADREALERFVQWVSCQTRLELSVFFTPWGEALVHRAYQSAVVELSRLPQVRKVAIQTNLSCPLEWAAQANPWRLGLWTTYHPTETRRPDFLAKCQRLDHLGVRYSVGMVGLREHLPEMEAMRQALPASVYFWVNARQPTPADYDEALMRRFSALDPLFPLNRFPHPSRGQLCHTGNSIIAVDGAGAIRRCHFVPDVLGNLYTSDLADVLAERPCPREACDCHIGYVHLAHLRLDEVFGEGLLERVRSNPGQ
jgi:MoaA/NifB/PqqE/SkfB family radical SAM enzyme